MVGVPRSSGCRICVQRRVRCDGARPTCNNCRKGNRPCPGYGPGVKFQDEGPKLRQKYQKEQISPSDSDSSDDRSSLALTPNTGVWFPSSSKTPKQWNILGLDIDEGAGPDRLNVLGFVEGKLKDYLTPDALDNALPWDSKPDPQQALFADEPDLWKVLTAPILSPETQQMQLISSFNDTMIPQESRYLPKAMRTQANWLTKLPGFIGSNVLLDTAIRAVTLVHIGILHKNHVFIMESRPYYGKALRLLNMAINNKQMAMDNKTLCATILLSFYEMFASDEDASWVRHAGGAGALMRMRGPKRHRHGFDRDIFMAYRHTLVIEAMTHDQPSFLDEPEWRQLSAEIYDDLVKNNMIPKDRVAIFDIAEEFYSEMAAISVVTSKSEALHIGAKSGHLMPESDVLGVSIQLQAHRETLQGLFDRWKLTLTNLGHYPPLKPVDDPVITHQYQYTNVFTSSFNVGFWTTMMMVDSSLYPLAEHLGWETEYLGQECVEFATESCRSVDFMLKSSFLGPFFTVYALRFSYQVFKPGDIRSDWALCKLVEIGDHRMMFAKGAIRGGAFPDEKPEQFYVDAKQRLDEYNARHEARRQPMMIP